LENLVGRQPDSIFDPLGFEKLVDLGIGEARIAAPANLWCVQHLTWSWTRAAAEVGLLLNFLPGRRRNFDGLAADGR
jgi:hypothetical protein